MYEDNNSEMGPKGTFETYRAEGDTLFKQGEYNKAIESYSTALEIESTDKNCLVARSKCYLQLGDTERALHDAESALAEDKEFHKGLFQKAEALYSMGNFELSLVFYHRGHKLRPELQEFRLGIQKAQEAIVNSVGSPAVKLTKEGDLSFFNQQEEGKGPKKRPMYGRPSTKQKAKGRQPPPKTSGDEKTVKQLLGELYGDKAYLEKLLKETDPSTTSGNTIYDLVCEGLKYLDTRTEFWRQQKPMYARKLEKQDIERQRKIASQGGTPQAYFVKELEKINKMRDKGKHEECLRMAKQCMATLKAITEKIAKEEKDSGNRKNREEDALPNKNDILSNLYSFIGNAFLELGKFEKALTNHKKDLEVAKKNNLLEAQSRALDNIGRVHARLGKYEKAVETWEQKLALDTEKSLPELTWLYHEIGRCNFELSKLEDAMNYAEKAMATAREAKDEVWQLNTTILIAQVQVKQKELDGALQSFELALDLAKVQGDDTAEQAITRAIQNINEEIVRGLKDDNEGSANNNNNTSNEAEGNDEVVKDKEDEPAEKEEEQQQEGGQESETEKEAED
ncbi:unnamed protein product [Owenia fusiformis]|uniref:Outer dynein arm-docking complex subunit 4 n=1 Tax=Owenia fusiformis TaxID=6347 RepID=A0A8J1Y131_OWEFU|nr:unnamed protein product [Owenia fusiformis]